MVHVLSVKYAGGLSLELEFDDGTDGQVDLTDWLARVPSFAQLLDPAHFRRAFVDDGDVHWPGDLSISTARLYALAHDLPTPDTHEQALANEQVMRRRSHLELMPVTDPAHE